MLNYRVTQSICNAASTGLFLSVCVCVHARVRACVSCQRDYPSCVSFTKGHMFLHKASSSTEQHTHSTTHCEVHIVMNYIRLYVCFSYEFLCAHTCTYLLPLAFVHHRFWFMPKYQLYIACQQTNDPY